MLPPGYPVDAPRHFYQWRQHQIAYYVDGPQDAPPLLLVHSINAAASAFEMRKTFAGLRDTHRVYAFDLLGYGGSDRPAEIYTGDRYAVLIGDLVRDLIGRQTRVVASSLGCAYAIRAAARAPELFGALLLACPTGIEDLAQPQQPGAAYALLRSPIGDLLFSGLASRPSIRYFLAEQSYFDPKAVDAALVEGFYQAANQPGGKYAPICFLTGLLSCAIEREFASLQQRILLVWGREAEITPPRRADAFLRLRPQARLEVIDRARLSVQDEHPDQFNQLARQFFAAQPGAA